MRTLLLSNYICDLFKEWNQLLSEYIDKPAYRPLKVKRLQFLTDLVLEDYYDEYRIYKSKAKDIKRLYDYMNYIMIWKIPESWAELADKQNKSFINDFTINCI